MNNDQSPPKRVTRARAAAKTSDAGVKIATAAAKAKLTRSASTTTKRKTRAHDEDEQDELADMPQIIEPEPTRATRGRVKKAPETAMNEPASVAPKTTRGRAKKETPAPPPEPTRALRGRAKKIEVSEEAPVVEEAPKRAVRTRATTITKAAPPKKSVKFQEPDKENVLPVTAGAKGKAKSAEAPTGLRAKPVRKPAASTTTTTARATRGRAKSTTEEKEQKSSPLSPKKATQVGASRGHISDDELATTEKTPMKPLMKSPVKPPGSIFNTAKKLDFTNSMSAHKAVSNVTQDLGASAMGSPARRPPQSPFKDAIKASPQKITLGDSILRSPFKPSLPAPTTATKPTFKASLLHSPARRPQSPMKVSENGSPSRSTNSRNLFTSTPKVSAFKMSKFTTPRTINKSVPPPSAMAPASIAKPLAEDIPSLNEDSELPKSPAEMNLEFSGRLSSIVPRDVDPNAASSEEMTEPAEASIPEPESNREMMVIESAKLPEVEEATELVVSEDVQAIGSTTPSVSPSQYSTGIYAPSEEDENPFQDSDSEDELAAAGPFSGFRTSSHDFESYPSTPFTAIAKTPRTAKTVRYSSEKTPSRIEKLGFTPLARQLSDWMAASPEKSESEADEDQTTPTKNAEIAAIPISAEPSPVKSTYFDDEMSVRDELATEPEAQPEAEQVEPDLLEENFTPAELDDEDLDLAMEADEMSLLEPEEIEALEAAVEEHEEIEAALSEASQEYGNENDTLIDPALLSLLPPAAPKFSTPKRVLSERVCHTVSKVPLKPAADETPMRSSPKKRSASISRLPIQRPSGDLKRNNTVISYSPTKPTTPRRPQAQSEDIEMQDACTTPSKQEAEMWSNLGTPPRTPRRDVNTALLKGAVVFVDVHTTEGADASVLFNELLSQMGARCVKSWNWNGNAEDGSKVGITHVVFKDGGKRNLEKVREAGGVVACVGVGWVLDCERENKWVDEAPYAVDTSLVPRGGHRRRKSMEPRALANLNGTLVPSATPRASNMSPTKEFLNMETPYTSKSKRRESVQWVPSPASSQNDDELADDTLMLSPIPATPAPGMLSSYGEDGLYGEETPVGQTPYFLHNQELVQQTAPPAKGKPYVLNDENEGGSGSGISSAFLSEKKDPSVMMRLMAARRKSLQWAPKVGSPLARGVSGQW